MAKKKGYRPSERTTRRVMNLSFDEDHEFYGAEITMGLAASLDFVVDLQTLSEAGPEKQRDLIRQFGDLCIVNWNIEDRRGEPVPANGDGLVSQETAFVLAVIEAWIGEVVNPSSPLSESSAAGGR